jgi:hypothetical protein
MSNENKKQQAAHDDMWDIIKGLKDDVRGLQIEVARLMARFDALRQYIPGPLYVSRLAIPTSVGPLASPAPFQGPAPEGGSRADKPLYGYQSDHAASCQGCGEPAESHICPEVR